MIRAGLLIPPPCVITVHITEPCMLPCVLVHTVSPAVHNRLRGRSESLCAAKPCNNLIFQDLETVLCNTERATKAWHRQGKHATRHAQECQLLELITNQQRLANI